MRKIVSRITAWSFSRWDVHTRCPYQFKLKFLEKREETQHPAAARGEMLHKKSEDYVERRVKKLAPELIDERVRFLLGGFCADRRFNPALADRRNSSIDFEQALHLIPTDERKWHRLLTEADLLVTQYRRAIQNVALELLEREVLKSHATRLDHSKVALIPAAQPSHQSQHYKWIECSGLGACPRNSQLMM